MFHLYWSTFLELLAEPFRHEALIWGIVPLYFALLLNEMTSNKANYRTAVQTGFSFLWAGAQWLYPYFKPHDPNGPRLDLGAMLPVNLAVTAVVVVLGFVALFSGLRLALSEIRLISRLHPVQQLFHDHALPDTGALPRLDLGSSGGHRPVRAAHLGGTAFWPVACSQPPLTPPLDFSPCREPVATPAGSPRACSKDWRCPGRQCYTPSRGPATCE